MLLTNCFSAVMNRYDMTLRSTDNSLLTIESARTGPAAGNDDVSMPDFHAGSLLIQRLGNITGFGSQSRGKHLIMVGKEKILTISGLVRTMREYIHRYGQLRILTGLV